VRVEVSDADERRPSVRWPDPAEPRGRGLQIVNALADRWGVEAWADGKVGKTVWFMVELDRSEVRVEGEA
ncbi:MAG: ATP-binding protein, partial [Acidimicrobiales bacterium]|nr:ATP-binding protein [Acidimicrobiales bacterium]